MGQMGRALLCLLLLVAVVLAGCSSTTESGTSTTSKSVSGSKSTSGTKASGTGSQTGPPTSGGGGGGGTGDNNPPTGAISASIPSGAVPLTVKFDLKGTDQDGDDLSWNLDLDGDGKTDKTGEALPATESYNYTVAGSYNVSFAISDGTDTVTYKVTINATGEGGGAGATQVISGSWTSGSYGCALYPTAPGGSQEGVFYLTAVINPALVGTPYTADFVSAPAPGVPAYYNLIFVNEGGDIIESHLPPIDGSQVAPAATATYTGTVPADTYYIVASSCGAGGTITMNVGA